MFASEVGALACTALGCSAGIPDRQDGVPADGNALRYLRAVLTRDQIQDARRRAAHRLEEAGFVLTDLERDNIEVADFGLSELEHTGWRSSSTSTRSGSAPRRS